MGKIMCDFVEAPAPGEYYVPHGGTKTARLKLE